SRRGLAEMAVWCVEDFADFDISASIFSCHPACFSQIPAHVLNANSPGAAGELSAVLAQRQVVQITGENRRSDGSRRGMLPKDSGNMVTALCDESVAFVSSPRGPAASAARGRLGFGLRLGPGGCGRLRLPLCRRLPRSSGLYGAFRLRSG